MTVGPYTLMVQEWINHEKTKGLVDFKIFLNPFLPKPRDVEKVSEELCDLLTAPDVPDIDLF